MNPAVAQVFDNPYLCWELCRWHPTVYARLLLVSRRFKDWLDGKEEISVYDPVLRTFNKKTTDKSAFKQKYMESWVVWIDGSSRQRDVGIFMLQNGALCAVEIETRFRHNDNLQSVQERPAWKVGVHATWYNNGKQGRKNGPSNLVNWPTMSGYDPRYPSYKKYGDGRNPVQRSNGGPWSIEIHAGRSRHEFYWLSSQANMHVVFDWVDGSVWKRAQVRIVQQPYGDILSYIPAFVMDLCGWPVPGPALNEDTTE